MLGALTPSKGALTELGLGKTHSAVLLRFQNTSTLVAELVFRPLQIPDRCAPAYVVRGLTSFVEGQTHIPPCLNRRQDDWH